MNMTEQQHQEILRLLDKQAGELQTLSRLYAEMADTLAKPEKS